MLRIDSHGDCLDKLVFFVFFSGLVAALTDVIEAACP